MRRYGRHLVLPEVGRSGQRRLKAAKVAIVGLGGLGCAAALYLAAAGVGELGLVDADAVDRSNLQRQVLYGEADVGRPKLAAAEGRLRVANPATRLRRYDVELDRSNALEVLAPYDVVIDGTDNHASRYLINDACVLLGTPDVFAAVHRFEAQASVFDAARGPCYRCLFPEPAPPGAAPSCDAAGVLGVLPGLVGVLQATEALKLVLGVGDPLIGRFLLFDALSMRFREFPVARAPGCLRCSRGRRHGRLDDLPSLAMEDDAGPVPTVTPEQLDRELHRPPVPLLLDVREPAEYAINHLPRARLIPLGELAQRYGEVRGRRPIVVYCRTGNRSRRAVHLLAERGLERVRHLEGGINAWSERIDRTMPTY
jgi:adenylyltransferase/sulfurtransferase